MVNESVSKKYGACRYGCCRFRYSQWNKRSILSQISVCMEDGYLSLKCNFEELKKMPKDLLKEQCLIAPAHHPGVPYEDSELCYLDIRNIEELTNGEIKELISSYKKSPPKPAETKIEIWLCAYPVLCASGKRYKSKKVTEIGKIINDTWFICSNGERKRVSAREFEKIKRIDEEEGENLIKKKFVYEFPEVNLGTGIAGSLILVGGSGVEGGFFLEKLICDKMFDCVAHVVEGYDVWIDSEYALEGEYRHWLKIYNADGMAKEFKADRILVYSFVGNSACCVIQLINEAVDTKLYKNVDICDLDSIVENGVLSLDECGNDNWGDGRSSRADNPTDRVYLFAPVRRRNNTYPVYGVALLETDTKDVKQNEFAANDVHKDDYIEYTTAKVEPAQITRILIPEILKEKIYLSEAVEKKVEWCGITADIYIGDKLEPATDEVLKEIGESDIGYSLYNVNYIFQ
ncbi:MAG: hypothetical protein NC548_39260 [Lachnospiraceae bacterium]|nr:hypothetical protein [Lachnospiraceae bacterium]